MAAWSPRMVGRRRWLRWGLALSVCALLMAGVRAPAARADGDPASDYLIGQQVFFSIWSGPGSAGDQALARVVAQANRKGFAIRVAVIANPYALGAITALWHEPRRYARFLGLELSSLYHQRLLVVMPNGFGFNWPGHPSAPAYRLLAAQHIAPGANGLAEAAASAVRGLAAAAGVAVPSPGASAAGARSGASRGPARGIELGALAVAAALAAVALVAIRRRRPGLRAPTTRRPANSTARNPANSTTRRPANSTAPRPANSTTPRPANSTTRRPATSSARRRATSAIRGRKLLVTGAAVGLAACAATVVIVRLRPASAAAPSAAAIVTRPPYSWPAGHRPAPAFTLRDQLGWPVSPASFRGRPLIVTFIDPLCRNFCPLEARTLNEAVARLPANEKPIILAVNVDVYANRRAYLLQDEREWRLVPQWHWAVGSRTELAEVWRRYGIGVQVTTRHAGATLVHTITHTEAAYVVDPSGHERALFLWPFYPQDVVAVIRRLA